MKYYKISEDELVVLLSDSMKLDALIDDGVDNWCWYGEGFRAAVAINMDISEEEVEKNNYDFDDAAKYLLKDYPEVP